MAFEGIYAKEQTRELFHFFSRQFISQCDYAEQRTDSDRKKIHDSNNKRKTLIIKA